VDDAGECWLERYHQQALEQGGRVRERLRDGVEETLVILGCGFLRHPAGDALRRQVRAGQLTPAGYYRQLLRLVYRLLFLMVSEERGLVGPEDAHLAQVYRRYYSLARLRDLAEGYFSIGDRHGDLWQGLCQTFRLYEERDLARRLGMEALDGDLFGPHAIPDLEAAGLFNADLLRAMRCLSIYREERAVRRVNYAALDVEELGSVYESLLEYHPVIEKQDGQLTFAFVLGMERKTTGSYYTRPELVQELIKSALEPVIADRMQEARSRKQPEEETILSIKVCDPACGSGHFLLAAARRLGRELARVRTGEEHPPPTEFRRAVRDVIRRCIYGVDKNPLAVDLCRVALWLEGHSRGLPLTFLDHRIKCGDSLVGVLDLDVFRQGIPDEAYQPVSGDDKKVAAGLKKRNRQEREGQLGLFDQVAPPDLGRLAGLVQRLSAEPDQDVDGIRRKAQDYEAAHAPGSDWRDLWTACNLWTAAFFAPLSSPGREPALSLSKGAGGEGTVPTTAAVRRYLSNPRAAHGQTVGLADALSVEQRLFHWPLEFPDVFTAGGFDVVLCNPPWERIKLQEKEFFPAHDPAIARAPSKAIRERLIQALPQTNPALLQAYQQAKHDAEALSKYLRGSEAYPLTARGDINTYPVFAERFTALVNPVGRVGMLVPTGIATEDTNKYFFANLVEASRLVSLFDFANVENLFPAIDSNTRFCLLTVAGSDSAEITPEFAFFATRAEHLKDERRRYSLTLTDIARINPNTHTCALSRTRQDADLMRRVYERVPVLHNEQTDMNPWKASFLRMFDMTNDSGLFRTREQLETEGFGLEGNRFIRGEDVYLPLYEAKMMHLYDHRFAHADEPKTGQRIRGTSIHLTEGQHGDPDCLALPRYWVTSTEVEKRLPGKTGWHIGFRNVAGAVTNIRTATLSLLPAVGAGNSVPLLLVAAESCAVPCLVGCLSSLVLDYVVRQKVGGINLNFHYVKQFPVLPPTAYTTADLAYIVPRVLELVYTAWDIKPFADDVWREADEELRAALQAQWKANAAATGGHVGAQPPAWVESAPDGFPHPPFKWDEERRAVLRAELDALYARLYGLTEEELRYILDPADVYGPDFPGETFRVLKEKEMRQYGEYRTRRLVLEAWSRLLA
jgi:hypothetical protein